MFIDQKCLLTSNSEVLIFCGVVDYSPNSESLRCTVLHLRHLHRNAFFAKQVTSNKKELHNLVLIFMLLFAPLRFSVRIQFVLNIITIVSE